MITLYNIIPRGDGYHYMCLNQKTNELEPWNKGFSNKPEHLKELIFKSEEDALNFLRERNLFDTYVPQQFWMAKDYAESKGLV